MDECRRVAILIDAENVHPTHADQIFKKAESLGTIVHKEIYGAATAISMWVSPVLKYVIHTNLSIRTTKGKNTSDIALAIGAMDIIMQENIDYMIIVSSDSDFSTLAVRLRNANVTVVGMGSEAVNPLWKVACSDFVTLEYTSDEKNEFPSDDEDSSSNEEQTKESSILETPVSAEDRRALIFKVIQKQISNGGGKVSSPKLFLALNNLPAYQVDKQISGFKKAQQYLSSVFSEKIRLEIVDGTTWVYLIDSSSNESSDENVLALTDNENISEDDDVLETGDESENDQNPMFILLQNAGIEEAIATDITTIATESSNKLSVFNNLRSKFGNNLGSEYYHQIREWLH